MDICAIASASINRSLARTQADIGVAMLRKTMDIQQTTDDTLIQSMGSVTSSHLLDMKV
jgi:hypothetical protein